jgi:hypothetical protein
MWWATWFAAGRLWRTHSGGDTPPGSVDSGLVTVGMMAAMADWTVRLPPGVREPYEVYINGVRQQPGRDYEVRGLVLVFDRPLAKEGRLGFWRWFWGAWGIGTYRKNDQVDITWQVDGRPRVAHAVDIEPPEPTIR